VDRNSKARTCIGVSLFLLEKVPPALSDKAKVIMDVTPGTHQGFRDIVRK
jgi:hypothetical protein